MNSEVFQAWQNKFTSNSDKSTKVSLSSKTTEYREETQKNKRFVSNLTKIMLKKRYFKKKKT